MIGINSNNGTEQQIDDGGVYSQSLKFFSYEAANRRKDGFKLKNYRGKAISTGINNSTRSKNYLKKQPKPEKSDNYLNKKPLRGIATVLKQLLSHRRILTTTKR